MNLNCEQTFLLLQDYLDRELSTVEAESVERHLAECGICSDEYVFEARVLRRVRSFLEEIPIPDDLFDRVGQSLAAADDSGHA